MNYIFLILNVMCWTIAPIAIKWLSPYFDMHTQNFYRYLGASIFLFIFARIIHPAAWTRGFKKMNPFLLPALFMAATQILWVSGIYLSKASLAMFVAKLDLIFIILFSYLIFQDEREKIRSIRFKIGVTMVLIGVAGIIAGQGRLVSVEIGWGIFFIFFSRITWALYAVRVKMATVETPPLVSSSLAIAVATLFLLPVGLGWGNLNRLCAIPLWGNIVLFGSGIIGVGAGQALFHTNIKRIGTVITSSAILSTPLFVLIFAYFILGERLTLFQILSGLIILAGCYIILPLTQKIPYRAIG